MNKAVFLDRDGTINVEKHYLYRIEDFVFLPGVLDGLRLLQNAGYILIIATNQSGIARGYYSEDDFINLNEWMTDALEENGIHISKVYYCPHLPDAKIDKYRKMCVCRKPALGMYEQAAIDFKIDLSNSWAIGDKLRDCILCEKTKCRGFLVGQNVYTDETLWNEFPLLRNKVRCMPDLFDCAKIITEEDKK